MASSPASVCEDDDTLVGVGGAKKRGKVRKESEHKRRLMMNQYFDELVILLSMVTETVSSRKMDKVTTLHEAVNLFKLYYDLDQSQGTSETMDDQIPQIYRPEFLNFGEVASFLLNSLGAFLMVLSETGRILYSTDLITSLTGYLPCRVVGQTIYDCIHKEDHIVVKDLFRPPGLDGTHGKLWTQKDSPIICYPPKSLRCHFKVFSNDSSMIGSSRAFSCLSYLRQWKEVPFEASQSPMGDSSSTANDASPPVLSDEPTCCILLIAKLDESLSVMDEPVISNGSAEFSFDMRISKEGKILDMSKQASLILGYTSTELVGSLFFDYVDPFHLEKVSESIVEFLKKGLGVSQPYRLISKSTRSVWVVSKGFLSYNPWNHKPDHILLQCKILGCDEVLSECRFSQEKRYLPDLRGEECYRPGPVALARPVQEQRSVRKQPQQQPVLPTSSTVSHPLPPPTMPLALPPMSIHPPTLLPPSLPTPLPPSLPTQLPPTIRPGVSNLVSQPQTEGRGGGGGEEGRSALDEVRRELDKKNQELFEMQKKILAQQQLIEQERHQFYQVTNQVMSYIGSRQSVGGGGGSGNNDPLSGINMHPGMAMLIRNSLQTPPPAPPPPMSGKSPNFHLSLQQQQVQPFSGIQQPSSLATPISDESNETEAMSSHMSNHMMPPQVTMGHMTNQMTSHMTNQMSSVTGHMTNQATPVTSHVTNQMTGHMTNQMSSVTGHMTNQMMASPGHMTNKISHNPQYAGGHVTPGHMPTEMEVPFPGMLPPSSNPLYSTTPTSNSVPSDSYLPSYLPSELTEPTVPMANPSTSSYSYPSSSRHSSISNPVDEQQRLLLNHLQQLYRSYSSSD